MFSIITSATNKVLVSIKRLCDIIIVDQRTYKYTVYYIPLQIRIHWNLSGRLLIQNTCILVQVGGPRKRFLAINSGKASDFLQDYNHAYYTKYLKNLVLNSHITKLTLSHITRGDWSPMIFKIACYALVLSHSTLLLRSYKFATIRCVIKL